MGLLTDAENCARFLLKHFKPGEHIAVCAHNLPEWVVLQYGVALAGCTLVMLIPSLQPAELRTPYVKPRSNACAATVAWIETESPSRTTILCSGRLRR